MALKAQSFLTYRELVKFVADNSIAQADIQEIVFSAGDGHYVLFYWA